MKKNICVYHKNCADGMGAAWAHSKAKENAIYLPAVYKKPPPLCVFAGNDVAILDLSFPHETLLEIAKVAANLTVIDHHLSAEDNLMSLPVHIKVVFDPCRSACCLAWQHYHPTIEIPTFLRYIEDRDIWKYRLLNSREITAAIHSYDYSLDSYDVLSRKQWDSLLQEGQGILRYQNKVLLEHYAEAITVGGIGDWRVPFINAPHHMASDICNMLCEDRPFALSWYATDTEVICSLRSESGREDVGKIAAAYGGGGHKHAAGITFTHEEARRYLCIDMQATT